METYHNDVIGCFIWDLQETSWIRTNETSLGVSFETCLRRREDVLMRRCCYILLRRHHDVPTRCRGDVPRRRLNDVPSRRRWVFHLRRICDVAGTYREASLQRRHDVLLPGRGIVGTPPPPLPLLKRGGRTFQKTESIEGGPEVLLERGR